MTWYEAHIEEGVRDIVKLLRDNGFNTTSSCHHENPMQIQCEYSQDGEIGRLHDLIYNYLIEVERIVTFSIHVEHEVVDGHCYSFMEVKIPK